MWLQPQQQEQHQQQPPPARRRQPQSDPQQSSVAERIKAAGNSRRWDEAHSLFASCKRPGIFEYSAAIQAARLCREYDEATALYEAAARALGQDALNVHVYDQIIAMHLDYNDDASALRVFNQMVEAERARSKPRHLTPAGEIVLRRCVTNGVRASVNLHVQVCTAAAAVAAAADRSGGGDAVIGRGDGSGSGGARADAINEEVEQTLARIDACGWALPAKARSLLVRSYASANMTAELARWSDAIFRPPLPDVFTLETYMNAMLAGDMPLRALTAFQWYLPTAPQPQVQTQTTQVQAQATQALAQATQAPPPPGAEASQLRPDPEALFAPFVPDALTIAAERNASAEETSSVGDEAGLGGGLTVTARCLGYAMKAIWQLPPPPPPGADEVVRGGRDEESEPSEVESPGQRAVRDAKIAAVMYLLRYAEESNDLSTGLVVTAIAACRELRDWQNAFHVYNTAKLAAKEGRFFDVSATSVVPKRYVAKDGHPPSGTPERVLPMLQGLSLEKGRKGGKAGGVKLPRPSALAAIDAVGDADTATATAAPVAIPIATGPATRASTTTASSGSGARRPAVGLPSIVYGQAVVTMAKGGAESQTFQIFCEMLEAGIVPSEITTNNVLMELSKKGSYKVAMSTLDRLYRYKIPVSKPALNSLFNACDKAGAYDKVIEIFATKRVTAAQIDELGLSVLIKSCDRLGDAEWAVMILKEVIRAGMHVGVKYYQRVFAILVKSPNAAQLAVELLLHIETAAAQAAAPAVDEAAAAAPPPSLRDTPPPVESERDRYLRELFDDLSAPGSPRGGLLEDLFLDDDVDDDDGNVGNDGDGGVAGGATSDLSDGLVGASPDIQATKSRASGPGPGRSKAAQLTETLQEVLELGAPPKADPCIYAAVISSLSHNRLAREACALLKSYVARGGAELEEMYTSAIHAFRYQRNPDAAEAVFRQLQRRTAALANADADASLAPVSVSVSVPPLRVTTPSYNALLSVYAVSKVLDERGRADQLLAEMRVRGLAWDSYTYTALIAGRGDRREVIRLWEDMLARGHVPTEAAASVFFKACEFEGTGDTALAALNLLFRLHDADKAAAAAAAAAAAVAAAGGEAAPAPTPPVAAATPDMIFCTRTLNALSAQGRHDDCLELLGAMRDRGLVPTAACYATTLGALERAVDWKKAVNLLLQMQTRGVFVDYRAVNAALSACAKSEQWEMVLKLFDQMPTVTSHTFVPNQFSYFQATQAACRTKDAVKALELLRAQAAAGFAPTSLTVSQVLAALETARMFDDTVAVFEEFVAQHLSIDHYEDPGVDGNGSVLSQLREQLPDIVGVTPMVVDLHGYSTPMARAAVRSALRCLWEEARQALNAAVAPSSSTAASVSAVGAPASSTFASLAKRSLVIIVGKGFNSRDFEPVLKPNLSKWLMSDFQPPIVTEEVQDNSGRLIVPGESIFAWILHRAVAQRVDSLIP